jgi:hypothetical protein
VRLNPHPESLSDGWIDMWRPARKEAVDQRSAEHRPLVL